MADSSYFRGKAEQAIRLARDSTDPVLQKSLTELALDYFSRAVAIEAFDFGKDSNSKGP
jgi:hypothetical protein